MFAGQRLVSDDCDYHLDMQPDGNLVLYDGVVADTWSGWATAQQAGFTNLLNTFPSYALPYAILQTSDGNFVEYQAPGSALWSSKIVVGETAHVYVLDAGILGEGANPESALWWQTPTNNGVHPGPNPCIMKPSKTLLTNNENYGGGTNDVFAQECASSFQECGTKCVEDVGLCKSWTWVAPGQQYSCSSTMGQCWYKSNVPELVPGPGMVSGLIEKPAPPASNATLTVTQTAINQLHFSGTNWNSDMGGTLYVYNNGALRYSLPFNENPEQNGGNFSSYELLNCIGGPSEPMIVFAVGADTGVTVSYSFTMIDCEP